MVAELLPNNEIRGDLVRADCEPTAQVLCLKYGLLEGLHLYRIWMARK
jgi:hypothetical protein